MLVELTLRLCVIVVEVLFPLGGGEVTHITDKEIFFVVATEPVGEKRVNRTMHLKCNYKAL